MSKFSVKTSLCLRGRVCLITGATGGVGKLIASTLADLGADLALVDISKPALSSVAKRLSRDFDVIVKVFAFDFEDEPSVLDVPGWIFQSFGRLDILVNNAAFVGTSGLHGWAVDFSDQSLATWRRALEVNLTAAFALTQGCQPLLAQSGHGSVINIGSIYGLLGPDLSLYEGTTMNNPAAYAASKGGLLQLTRWLATVLAPKIRVNAISPGGLERGQPQEFIDRYISRTPLRRMGREEDIMGAVAYLASDLSSWVTGQNIVVDGGWSVW